MKRMLVVFVLFAVIQISAQWTEQNSGLTTALNSVFVLNNNYAFACGEAGKVISTSDGGTTWNVVSNATIPATLNLTYIAAVDSVTFGVLGTDASATYAYFTNNGGSNWFIILSQTGGDFNVAGFVDSNTILIQGNPVGGRWSLFKSSNLFIWDSTGLYLPQLNGEAGLNNSIFSYPNAPHAPNYWFGTDAGHIYHSGDGGASWESQSTPGMTNIFAIHFNGNNGLAGGDGLCKTTDFGTTWSQLSPPSAGDIFGICGIQGTQNFWAASPTALYSTTDFGTTWNNDFTPPGGNYTNLRCSATLSGEEIAFAVRNNGGISKLVYSDPIPVAIDIKPQSCPNSFNVKKKSVMPVAILGTGDFDVLDIDPTTVLFEGVAPIRWAIEDVTTPVAGGEQCDCTTEGPDGFDDLTLKFDAQELVTALGQVNNGDELELTITGNLLDGTPFEGSDCVIIKAKNLRKDLTGNSSNVPEEYALFENYPNPFNPSTNIKYSVPENNFVSVKVYDVLGEEVASIINEEKSAGSYEVNFDASNLSSGIYFYTMRSGSFLETKKMVLMK